jgi:CRP-like cAMP-binding protein
MSSNASAGVLDCPVMKADSCTTENLRAHYLFAGLDATDFDALMQRVVVVKVEKGRVLFQQGDKAEHFYYVDKGQLELNFVAPTGQKKVLEVLGSERTFAEAVAFMREHKYPVSCEALSDAVVCRIPNQDYIDIIYRNPDAAMRLLSDVCRQLHARVREIERLTIQNARDRLVGYLLEHIVESNDDEATIRVELPRHVIASRLSITPETLSRLLRTLVEERIVTIEDRVIFVHSLARLRPYD